MSNIIKYPSMKISGKVILEKGSVLLPNTGLFLIKGSNGVGKSLFLSYLFSNLKYKSVLVQQKNNSVVTSLSVKDNIFLNETPEELIATEGKYGFDYLYSLNPEKLSGGERRLISLLRALCSDSKIVLLDEPTSDLDYTMVERLVNVLESEARERLIIVATHDDRLDNIAKKIFCIKESTLISDDSRSDEDDQNSYIQKRIFNESILGRVLKYPMVTEILLCLLGLFLMINALTIVDRYLHQNTFNVNIPNNQVDFYHPVSVSAAGFEVLGGLPLTYTLDFLEGKIPDLDLREYSIYDYSLILENLDGTDVYPLEFYNPSTNDTVYTLDICIQELLDEDINSCWIDTSELFYYDNFGDENEAIPISKDCFLDGLDYIYTNYPNYIPVFTACVYNQNVFPKYSSFLQQNVFKELKAKGIYIYSMETANMFYSIKQLLEEKKLLRAFAITLFFIICVYIAWLLFWGKHIERNVIIFRNYGYSKEMIKSFLFNRKKSDMLCYIIFVAVGILCSIPFLVRNPNSITVPLLTFMYIITLIAFGSLKRVYLKLYLNQCYSWKHR